MNLAILRVKIDAEKDIEVLRNLAYLLVKCVGPDMRDSGYCVVDSQNPPYQLFSGGREECIAFVSGYESAPKTDVGCLCKDSLCVCVDTPSLPIIIPEEQFGKTLGSSLESFR